MEPTQTKTHKIFSSVLFKMVIIGILVLVLLIPAVMISNLINERENLSINTELEIQEQWGKNQTISGPMLSIPYYREVIKDNKPVRQLSYIQVLPDKLDIIGTMEPEIRYRGIYKVVVYTARLKISGFYTQLKNTLESMGISDIQWSNAHLNIGISDLRGVENELDLLWDMNTQEAEPGIAPGNPLPFGIHIPIDLSMTNPSHSFELELGLRGSGSLFFIPMGKTTKIDIQSDWAHPGFHGAFLPTGRTVNEQGFEASWTILHYNRSFPQVWENREYSYEEAAFGVNLLLAVDDYQKNQRSIKYAILFLVLTFTLIFFVEILFKSSVHPAQYLMVGASLIVFYVLLLSLSEQLGFQLAFLIAASAITIQIVSFIHMIIKSWKISMITAGMLLSLYAFLYLLLQLQDFSLLLGSVGLFMILGIIMILSRKINWYKPMEEL